MSHNIKELRAVTIIKQYCGPIKSRTSSDGIQTTKRSISLITSFRLTRDLGWLLGCCEFKVHFAVIDDCFRMSQYVELNSVTT